MQHHPWRAFRQMGDWTYYVADLPPGVAAATRWSDKTIWLRPGLSQVQRRCAIEHERQHALRGEPGLYDKDEAAVRQATARALIPLDRLIDVAKWTTDLHEAADELWVTADVLRTRIEHLHPSEHHAIRSALSEGEDLHAGE